MKGLKALWHVQLDSGKELRHNNQAQPLVHDGVVYIATGQNDVFAISVDTGKVLWEYRSGLKDGDAFVCCLWANRGVGLGDGRGLSSGRLDAVLVALDQRTGKVLWETKTGEPKLGYSLTAAPLYYDGMVIIGTAGGDLGIRGWVRRSMRRPARKIWRFDTIPGPGEFGHDTWPANSSAWQWGGAPVWSTPAIDPELGLIYFSTGNPGPSLGGAARPGDNLFTASIVALDVATGKYRWHFQEVHHDIWDYDAPNPIILFEAKYKGRLRKGLAQAGKTGWVYILDRTNGKPLIGINETTVMQEPRQATSPTQPVPVGDALVAQSIAVRAGGPRARQPGAHLHALRREGAHLRTTGRGQLAAQRLRPAHATGCTSAPAKAPMARAWMPRSSRRRPSASRSAAATMPVPVRQTSGIYTALDLATNRIVWQKRFNDGCRSGSLATAGGLVFLGRNDGRVTALDSSNGDRLWQFQTEAAVNSAVSTFMHKGQQMLVTYAGGGFVSAKKGDGVWLFSLNGTLDEIAPARAGRLPVQAPRGQRSAVADIGSGERIYKASLRVLPRRSWPGRRRGRQGDLPGARRGRQCSRCWARDATRCRHSRRRMTPEQLQDVAAYVHQKLLAK